MSFDVYSAVWTPVDSISNNGSFSAKLGLSGWPDNVLCKNFYGDQVIAKISGRDSGRIRYTAIDTYDTGEVVFYCNGNMFSKSGLCSDLGNSTIHQLKANGTAW